MNEDAKQEAERRWRTVEAEVARLMQRIDRENEKDSRRLYRIAVAGGVLAILWLLVSVATAVAKVALCQ